MRIARRVGVDGLCHNQAHHQVTAALGAEAHLDQLDCQRSKAPDDVLGARQTVMGEAEGFGQRDRIVAGTSLV